VNNLNLCKNLKVGLKFISQLGITTQVKQKVTCPAKVALFVISRIENNKENIDSKQCRYPSVTFTTSEYTKKIKAADFIIHVE